MAAGNAASGAAVDVHTDGVWELPKVAVDAFTLGALVYYDAATKLATVDDDDGANTQIGVAVAAAANGGASVRVRLSGF